MLIRILLFIAIVPTIVFANDFGADLKKCSTIADGSERLTCYDGIVNKPKAKVEVEVEVEAKVEVEKSILPATVTDKIAVSPEDAFGQEHLKKHNEQLVNSVINVITRVKKLNYDRLQLTFENGQVWRQTENVKIKLVIGDSVELTKGFFSVIYLQKVGSNKRTKMKRIK